LLETLITSKTRIKLLLKFFINPYTSAYLRGLEAEMGDSSNAIRLELNRFEQSGMIDSYEEGNKKMYKANIKHPMFNEIIALVKKYVGIDVLIQNIVNRLGDLQSVYLSGDLAKGIDSQVIDIVLVGEIDKVFLLELIDKAEKLINKKIRFVNFSEAEALKMSFSNEENLLVWNKDGR
jgi:hypothetical protein